jgi:hypothetical protein
MTIAFLDMTYSVVKKVTHSTQSNRLFYFYDSYCETVNHQVMGAQWYNTRLIGIRLCVQIPPLAEGER